MPAPAPAETEPVVTRIIKEIPAGVWAAIVGLSAAVIGLWLVMMKEHRRFRRAERDALTDSLTGLANRLGFEQRLATDWERARRYKRPLGLIVLDFDGFKRVNDTKGHTAGDDLLRRAGASIAERIRRSDLAARIGGDEFVVVTAETDSEGLEALTTSLRGALTALPYGLRVSIGCATLAPDDKHVGELFQRADLAMYRDKERRHSSSPASPPPAEPTFDAPRAPGHAS